MMGNDARADSTARRKLVGWKMISRHLGRGERAIQFWEVERGLPIRRIPGGRGHTVYAFVDELDRWMAGTGEEKATAVPVAAPSAPVAPVAMATRTPGILVLPFEDRGDPVAALHGDALGQQIVMRLSAAQQSLRVLSWTTSRSMRHGSESLDAIAARLHVRYVVEGAIERRGGSTGVDVRVIDAELDEVLLADRLVIDDVRAAHADAQLAEAIALHFALVHRGALVEPMCLSEVAPATLLDYLLGAACFAEPTRGAAELALAALERASGGDPAFAPAWALRGVALLRASSTLHRTARCAEARVIAASCVADAATRVTGPFLDAALALAGDLDADASERSLVVALQRVPHAIVDRGRLYDRRSQLRPRRGAVQPCDAARRGIPDEHGFLDELLRTLAACRHRQLSDKGAARDWKADLAAPAAFQHDGSVAPHESPSARAPIRLVR